jgi:hypothetical protein
MLALHYGQVVGFMSRARGVSSLQNSQLPFHLGQELVSVFQLGHGVLRLPHLAF